jgi:hypothetical protein
MLLFAASAEAATRLAILPAEATVQGAGARVDVLLIEAAQSMPDFTIVNLSGTKLIGPRRGEGRFETQPTQRARALGKELNAERAVAVEATPLGDGVVVYLQALEVGSGRPLGSTTLSFAGRPTDRDAARAALTRILAPARHLGRVDVHVDVKGAEVHIDGHPARAGVSQLPVGTHALRVTHPAYRDFLRFLDVEFDKTLPVEVNMAAYPLAEGEMAERQRRAVAVTKKRVPWYRSWWALSLSAALLTGATVGTVYVLRPTLPHTDKSSAYNPFPQP